MNDFIEISENTMLGDLMKCVIEQVKVLPKPWDALSENEQRDYLDRVELQVADAVRQAIRIITSQGHNMVPAKVDSVTYKDGCKVVLKAVGGIENTIHLAEAEGQFVNVIIPAAELLNGSGKPQPEPDQRGLELGEEYDDSATLDDGLDQVESSNDIPEGTDPLYQNAVEFVMTIGKTTTSSLQRHLRVGYNRAAQILTELEVNGVISAPNQNGQRTVIATATDDGIDHDNEYSSEAA